jgi:hypothetical protein
LKKELATAYQIIKGYEAEIKKNEEAHMTPELVHQYFFLYLLEPNNSKED